MARAPAFQAGDAGSIPVTCSIQFAPVAQLDRATAFYAVGRGFESLLAYHLQGAPQQSSKYRTDTEYVVGVAQLVRAPDCGSGCRGFESLYPPHKKSGIGNRVPIPFLFPYRGVAKR